MEFGVWSLEFGVWSLEFEVWSLEFRVWRFGDLEIWSLEFGVLSLEFRVSGSGLRVFNFWVKGFGFKVQGKALGVKCFRSLGLPRCVPRLMHQQHRPPR